MNTCLMVDFGSTYTKLTAIDVENSKILGVSKAFTTIETDVKEGFDRAVKELESKIGIVRFKDIYASSSAAGGLKMVSVGLVPDLTAKAARLASTSAGAKVLRTYAYELSHKERQEIYEISPDIILLSGGIDGGNKDVILHNAKMLSQVAGNFSVIIAGNKAVGFEVEEILKGAGKETVLCDNVMPDFARLNIGPSKNAIREIFIKNIINAKGLTKMQKIMSAHIVPTPLAVFNAMYLLSKGTEKEAGLGEIMAYDVGGATTDAYSMSDGLPKKPNAYLHGLKEPFDKRTVEGDIGMRYSILSLASEMEINVIAERAGVTEYEAADWIKRCKASPDILASNDAEKNIEDVLAGGAVEISAKRHCGFVETTYTPMGEALLQTGKDLTDVKYIIGSGGSVINSVNPKEVLSYGKYRVTDFNILKPMQAKLLLDKSNIIAAMGLLSANYKEVALKIMKDEFIEL